METKERAAGFPAFFSARASIIAPRPPLALDDATREKPARAAERARRDPDGGISVPFTWIDPLDEESAGPPPPPAPRAQQKPPSPLREAAQNAFSRVESFSLAFEESLAGALDPVARTVLGAAERMRPAGTLALAGAKLFGIAVLAGAAAAAAFLAIGVALPFTALLVVGSAVAWAARDAIAGQRD